MRKPSISVIMPIYNASKYLRKSIDSILMQTFTRFELILVNDGSIDDSYEICKEYKKRDKRVKIINKENTGCSESRNIGIEKSRGKYICFIDSDDWIEENMLCENYNLAETYNTDIIISGMYIDQANESEVYNSVINTYKDSIWDSKNKIHENIIKLFPNALINSSCNKLYKLELIKSIEAKFPNTNIGEDTLFNLEVIKYSTSIVINSKAYYHYMRHENNKTLTNSIIEDAYDKYEEIHKKMNSLFEYWGNSSSYIKEKINQTMFAQYFATTMKIFNSNNNIYSYKVKKKMLDKGLKKTIIKISFNYSIPYSYKEKIFRFTIRQRMYGLTILLLKAKSLKSSYSQIK